jgi:PAS domain S-box-containing protein
MSAYARMMRRNAGREGKQRPHAAQPRRAQGKPHGKAGRKRGKATIDPEAAAQAKSVPIKPPRLDKPPARPTADFSDRISRAHAELHEQNRLQKALRTMEGFRDTASSNRERPTQAEEALRASRDLYAELYDYAPIGYVTIDTAGVIENANHTAAALLGTDRASLLGRPFLTLVAPPDRASFLEYRSRAVTGRTVTIELTVHTADGRPVPVQLRTRESLVPGAGRRRRVFLMSILNLSEVRRNERERLRLATEQQQAQLASEAKDRFLAVLSHELRTPLTPILAAVSDPQLLGDATPALRDTLEMIRRNIGIEVQLVEDLLDVSRVSTGKLRLLRQPTDLHQIIREAVELLEGEARAVGLELLRDLRADHHWVRGDPTRLRQVVWNLLRNAIKFTPAGGRILTRSINAAGTGGAGGGAGGGAQITVSVRDSGIGIDPQRLHTLFTPFEQVNPAPAALGAGLGLGLTICQALVKAHDGTITAHSEGADTGSTFEFTLETIPTPTAADIAQYVAQSLAKDDSKNGVAVASSRHPSPRGPSPLATPRTEPPTKSPAAAPAPAAARGLSIMLVEDHPDTAAVMARLLQRQGYRVSVAHTYSEALALADEPDEPFDLAISDISLPDGSGLDLMRRIRSTHETTRGIALSGLASDADVQRSRDAGFDQHLAKPINFDQLLSVIATLASPATAVPMSSPPADPSQE